MSNPILTEVLGDRRLSVYDDEDCNAKEFAYSHSEYHAYGVIYETKCPCCDGWKEVSSLWGILEMTPENALSYFKEEDEDYQATIEHNPILGEI